MKTKTITLAGTAMAAVFAAGCVLSAQAATSAKENSNEKQITRQLNESQMQHPGVVNGNQAGANRRVSQNDMGTSSEDMNGQNTGYGTDGQRNEHCQFDESTGNGPNEQANPGENCNTNENTGYTPGTNDEDTGNMNDNENNPSNTGYTPPVNDEGVGGKSEKENNPYSGKNEDDSGAEDMQENSNATMKGAEAGAPLSNDDMRRAISATDVPNARLELQSATIQTRSGERIGTVQSVEVNADGTPRAVQADVDGRQISLDPNNLVYLKDHNALVTDLTKPQIENMPPVSKTY